MPPEAPPVVPPVPATSEPPKPTPTAVNPAVAGLCRDLLESSDDGVRFKAATELTVLKDPASIPALVKALGDDKHYFVRRGCARALGMIKAWFAVPALIKALEDHEVYVALMANIQLQNITGVDFGVTQDTPPGQRKTKAAAADKWWEKNKDKPPDGVCLAPVTN
jgi:HEAT repeat protein